MAGYAYYEFVRTWPELVVGINQLEIRLRENGRPLAADMLLKGIGLLREELITLSEKMALFATDELVKSERGTRVRPDTLGGGGPRLEDSLVAEPLEPDLLPGSVGVANEDLLDKNVPWWLTNETGSSARVGGKLYGTFYGQDSAGPPDGGSFRIHPLFAAGPSPDAGSGIIENPIPARYFIAKAVPAIDREWKLGFHAAKARFDATLDQALVTFR